MSPRSPRSFTLHLLLAATVALLPGPTAVAQQSVLPTGGHVVAGGATIGAPAGNSLAITQTTPRAVVNWNSFSVGQPNAVQFNQPGASAAILNRVTGNTPSSIAGQVRGNGQVYLVNPNGVAITPSGNVQVGGGFVASTLGIANQDFMAGKLNFTGNGASAPATNAGTISAGPGGYAALIGGTAGNSGTISVPLGKVALGSGEAATLDLNGGGFLQVAVPTGATTAQGQALVGNSGKISAAGGTVELKAATVAGAMRDAVNLRGVVTANSVSGQNGAITLGGGAGGAVNVTGTLDASGAGGANGGAITVAGAKVRVGHHAVLNASGAKGGTVLVGVNGPNGAGEADATTIADGATILAKDGGHIETSGQKLSLGKALIDAGIGGTWLTDPVDLTINSTAATTINNALGAGTSVTEQTTSSGGITGAGTEAVGNGDINVAAALSWSTSATLTLNAFNNVNVSAPITIGGGGQLVLTAGNGITVSNPITVSTNGGLALTTNSGSANPSATLTFTMGQGSAVFASEASNPTLTINGTTYTPIYSETEFDNITSGNYALAAPLTFTTTYSDPTFGSKNMPVSFFFGDFNGLGNTISGLTINDNHNNTSGNIGLFGSVFGTVSNIGLINPSVFGNGAFLVVGALVGTLSGTVTNSYAASTTTSVGSNRGDATVGGLVGEINSGSITDSYASIFVNATASIAHGSPALGAGGLVGGVRSGAVLTDVYATGAVTYAGSGGIAGGLVGTLSSGAAITNAYATGVITGPTKGGIAGANAGTITNGYFDTTTMGALSAAGSGAGSVSGGGGMTTSNLAGATVLAGLNGNSAWANLSNQTTPYLATNPGPLFLGTDGSATPASWNLVFTATQLQAISSNLAGNFLLAQNVDTSSIANFTPIGPIFTGQINGLGNTISNLTISSATDSADVGLFSQTTGATISNLGIVSGSITATGNSAIAGALVGLANSGTITNVYATIPVTAGGVGAGAGGLIGVSNADITNSYATGAVVAGDTGGAGGLVSVNGGSIDGSYATGSAHGGAGAKAGGFVGLNGGTITNSYATGPVSAGINSTVGGFVGLNEGPISNVYSAGAVSAGSGSDLGGFAGATDGLSSLTNAYFNQDRAGTATDIGDSAGDTATGLTGAGSSPFSMASYGGFTFTTTPGAADQWVIVDVDGSLNNASGAAGGTMPMLASEAQSTIVNAHQLQLLSMNPASTPLGTLTGSYTLGRSIDATATGSSTSASTGTDVWTSTGFIPVGGNGEGNFTGTFDGAGNTVSNLKVNSAQGSVGLFGVLGGGQISNIGLVGGSVTATASGASVGALVGDSAGQIGNSYATTGVSAGDGEFAGGLVGSNSGTISQSFAAGAVAAGDGGVTGGLVGEATGGSISNSFAAGPVTAVGGRVGGLVGQNEAAITDAYAVGSVTVTGGAAGSAAGGLVGFNFLGTITNAYATGAVSGIGGTQLGGLVASEAGTTNQGYWDTGTTGAPDNGIGTPEATSDLQAGLPNGFSGTTWGIIAGKSYPYLCWQAGNCGLTPQVVSGIAYSDQGVTPSAGATVTGLVNGTTFNSIQTLGGVTSGANGYYYYLMAPNTISNLANSVLTESATVGGAALPDPVTTGAVNNLAIYANTLHEITALTSNVAVQSNLATALGSASLPAGATGLWIDAETTFTVDSAISKTGAVEITTGTGALTVGSNVTQGNGKSLTLVSGGTLAFNSGVAVGTTVSGTVDLSAAGAVTEDATARINAQTFKSTGGVAGNVDLAGTNNSISGIGGFAVTGSGNGFALFDGRAINVSGTVSAPGNIFLQTSDSDGIVVNGGHVSAGDGQRVSFQTLFLDIAGGSTISAGATGTFELAPNTAGTFTIGTGGFLSPTAITAGTVRIGAVTLPGASTPTTTASAIKVGSVFSVSTATLDLETTGSITANDGSSAAPAITAATLTGNAGSANLTNTSNAIGTLGSFTAAVDFEISDGISLNVTGPVTAGTALTIGTSGGTAALTLAGNLTVTNGQIELNSGTTITQTAGVIDPAQLLIFGTGSVSLPGANTVDQLSAFITGTGASLTFNNTAHDLAVDIVSGVPGIQLFGGGDVTLSTTTSGNIALNQPIVTGPGTVTLNSAGNITQDTTNGAITAPTLTGSSVGGATFGAANVLDNIGPWTDTGPSSTGLSLTNSQALATAGTISSATGPVLLTATSGDLTINNPVSGTGFAATASVGTIFLNCSTGAGGPCASMPVVSTNSGGQTYANAVVVEADSTVDEAGAGAIRFESTVDAASAGGASLIVDGGASPVVFLADVGTGNPLSSFSVTTLVTGSTTIEGNITTNGGGQTYTTPLLIGGDLSLTDNGTGAITFTDAIDVVTPGGPNLVVSTGGNVTFSARVAGAAPLASLTVSAANTLIDNNVTTSGAQDYQGPVTLGGVPDTLTTTANGEIQFQSTVDAGVAGGSGLIANANGSGPVVFQNAVGGTKALSSLDVTGNSIRFTSNATVNTAGGGQTYHSPVTISGTSLQPTDSGNGAIDFVSTVNSDPGAPGGMTVFTGGSVTFGGAVGDSSPLIGLTATGGSLSLGGPITTAGPLKLQSTGSTGGTGNALTVGFALNAGTDTVTLQSAGAVIETSGGTVTGDTLTGSSVGGALLTEANVVSTFGAWTDIGAGTSGIAFVNSGAVRTSGSVSSAGDVSLTAGGNIEIGTLGADSVSAGIAGTLTLAAIGGEIGENPAASIGGRNLIATTQAAGGAPITLTQSLNAITGNVTLSLLDLAGTTPQPGTISFTDQTGFTIAANGGVQRGITTDPAGTVVLTTGMGAIDESSGIVSTGTLSGSSLLGATFGNTNLVSTLAGWTDTGTVGSPGFTLVSGESLTSSALVRSASAKVALTVTGAGNTLTLNSAVQAPTVLLQSSGSISQDSSVKITATNLVARTEDATDGAGSISLTGANAATNVTLTAMNVDGTALDSAGISYTSGGAFTIVGQTGGGVGHLETGIGTGAGVVLTSGGTIGETGIVTAASLGGSSVGGATLAQANQVAELIGFANATSGDVSFTNAQTLQVGVVSNPVGDLTLTTTSGDIDLIPISGTALMASATGTVALNSAGGVSGSAPFPIVLPTISAGFLSVTALGGSVDLPGANTVGTVAANLTASGASFDMSNAQALIVGSAGGIDGITTNQGTVLLQTTAGNLAMNQPISTVGGGTDLTGAFAQIGLSAAGSLTQAATGPIAAASAELIAGTGISMNANNAVLNLAAQVSGSGKTLNFLDTVDLAISDQLGSGVAAGSMTPLPGLLGVFANSGLIGLGTTASLILGEPVSVNTFVFGAPTTVLQATPGMVSLLAQGGDVSESGPGVILAGQLYAESDSGSVLLTGANRIGANDNGSGIAQTSGRVAGLAAIDFQLVNNNAGIKVDQLDCGCVGILTASGNIDLATTGAGAIATNAPLRASNGINIAVAPGYAFTNTASDNTNFDLAYGLGATAGLDTSASGQPVTILADQISLAGGTIDTVNGHGHGSGIVVLGPATQTEGIALGAASSPGTLVLQTADLANVKTGAVQIGYRNPDGTASLTGGIAVEDSFAVNTDNIQGLLLVTGGSVSETGGGAIVGTGSGALQLGILASGPSTFAGANNIGTLAAYLDGASPSLSLTNGGALTVGTLSGFEAGVSLDGNGFPVPAMMHGAMSDPLSGITTTGGVTLTTTAGGLTVGAPVSTGGLSLLAAGAIAFDDSVRSTASLSATAGMGGGPAGITQNSSGLLIQSSSADGASFTVDALGGTIDLGDNNSLRGTVSLLTNGSGADVTLVNGVALTLGGSTLGGNLTVSATGGMTVTGTVTSPGTIALNAIAGSGSAPLNLVGGANLRAPVIDLNATSIALTSNATLGETGATIDLAHNAGGGSVTETSGASIIATSLGATNGLAGNVSLATAGNEIDGLSGIAVSGSGNGIAISGGGVSMSVTGTLSTTNGPVSLSAPGGNLVLAAAVSAPGNAVALSAQGAISQTGGTITAATLAGGSSGGASLTQANLVESLGTFDNTGGGLLAFTDATSLTVVGPVSNIGGDIALTTTGTGSNLTLHGDLTASGNTVALNSAGMVTQQTGVITAATLSGGSTGGASLGDGNQVANFGPWNDRGAGSAGIQFADGENMTIVGAIGSPGPVSLSAIVDPDLVLNSDVTSGGTVTLFANGNIKQTAGTITGAGLVATTELGAGGSIALDSPTNAITGNVTLTSLNLAGAALAGGAISFADASPFTIASAGGLQTGVATAAAVTLVSGGDLTLAAGSVVTGGGVVLAAAGNFVNNAGSGAVTATDGNRWLVYSADSAGDAFGGLDSGNTAIWRATFASLPPASVSEPGNRYIFAQGKTLTVTTTDLTKPYGQDATAAVAAAFTVTGLQAGVAGAYLGDTEATALSGTPSVTSAGAATTASVAGGPYAITATDGTMTVMGGYALVFADSGRLTVTPAALTVTADSATKAYGSTLNFAGTEFTTAGSLFNGDKVTGVSLASAGAAATVGVAGGPYAITASAATGSGVANYTITYVDGRLTVTPAALTVTADSATKAYGSTLDFAGTEFTTAGSLFNGDTVTGVSLASAGAAATAGVAGGPYAITASAATGGGVANYAITYVNGALRVTPAALTVMAGDLTRGFGEANPVLTDTIAAGRLFNGDLLSGNLATAANAASAAGSYAITQGTLTAGANYTLAFLDGTLTVTGVAPEPLETPNFGVSPKMFIGDILHSPDWWAEHLPGGAGGGLTTCDAITINQLLQANGKVRLFGAGGTCGSL